MRLPPIGIIAEPPSCDETSCEMTVPNWIAGFVLAAAGKQHRSNKTAIFITLISASHPNNLRVKIMISRLLMAVAVLCVSFTAWAQVTVSPLLQPHQTFCGSGAAHHAPAAPCSRIPPGRPSQRPPITDAGGSVPNTNPVILSVQGGATCPSGSTSAVAHKFVLKNTVGTTLWTVDNVNIFTTL